VIIKAISTKSSF